MNTYLERLHRPVQLIHVLLLRKNLQLHLLIFHFIPASSAIIIFFIFRSSSLILDFPFFIVPFSFSLLHSLLPAAIIVERR